ncbi:hypothetical protein [Tardiphaga sp. P9-11]|uniref:hypothetical protein n=1 Tax=Tardiphaga sp. P9-11 TaxID=2024614 RepID=UPI001561C0C5|nr:hypothetical protein [Tardiphaga sp. P9-11]
MTEEMAAAANGARIVKPHRQADYKSNGINIRGKQCSSPQFNRGRNPDCRLLQKSVVIAKFYRY